MLTRVTNQMTALQSQQHLQAGSVRLAQAQERATSLDKLSRPSDDPTATAEALRVKSLQSAHAQHTRNVADGDGWLSTTDSALIAADSLMAKVRELTLQGANGSLSPNAKEAVAVELEGLKADLLGVANTSINGRSVFAGTSDAGVAFRADYSWTGTAGSSVTRRIGPETTVAVDSDGSAAFGAGASSVFALIDDIATSLRTGGDVASHLTTVDARVSGLRSVQSDMGARHAQLLRAEDTLMDTKVTLEAQRAGLEDLDLGQAVLDLQLQNNSYQAALQVTAKVLQVSLMDFLR
ncbi:flagellar hook-associated protein FlgL [Frigoribacterium sp. PhB116]|uniref:flagellar hook-associated protein FlgL n=1 Tax=Frigoribacterium sp. PhB116 TaxID=2485174 RepID=UPI000F4931C3|nr:flagellar hook-associated protein FlgL [Frigoribacterium sp. PhB116]ROP75335.1 flagellar hook-associated protein 3 FlgL [Frigoribacterium sp. PhB107]TDT63890.1 flagellar hook-associated protein 3 FlgL [Frigoribacterium sp. PhB116]